ncbi:mediator of RNA polymerase II transcription subunit 1-like isoform X2 [Pyxicephalus adspersus]|uniref:mediator of RNA polymerase II transcription subunit 1-like isoform X2 n=1 Tax=Pyxicephalus adspersus TaxID=30357 RepID=UPI003B5AA523
MQRNLARSCKRLESHLGPNGKICYITSEMFYIEVQVKRNGHVKFVKLAHHGESPTDCRELLLLLRTKDFEGFGRSLEGLINLYNIPGDSEMKAKVYFALCILEADLNAIFILQRPTTNQERFEKILHGKVGYLSPRCGGTPMNIEYYISPYQVVEEKLKPGTCVKGTNIFVTVMGTNNWYHLPLTPSYEQVTQNISSIHGFATFTDQSSVALPACFILTFAQPEPILLPLIHSIQNITGISVIAGRYAPLHELLIDLYLKKPGGHRGIQFIVSLPGCMKHCYVLSSGGDNESAVMGALVSKIPFTNPNHIPSVLDILRYQAAYNTLFNSCLTPTRDLKDHESLLHFEVTLQKDLKIGISFQHPSGSNLLCVIVEVLDPRKLMSTVYTSPSDPPLLCSNDFIVKIMEVCMSIPVTMRAIFKKVNKADAPETSSAKVDKDLPFPYFCEIPSVVKDLLCIDKKPTSGKNDPLSSVCDPNEELFPESVYSQASSPCLVPEISSRLIKDAYYSIAVTSSGVEEQHSSFADESCSSLVEDSNPIIVQELSPITPENTSVKVAEKQSLNIPEKLSSSITEELTMAAAAFEVPRAILNKENKG